MKTYSMFIIRHYCRLYVNGGHDLITHCRRYTKLVTFLNCKCKCKVLLLAWVANCITGTILAIR